MTLQAKYNKLENDCFNLLTVDPNLLHDLKHFSLILRLENTVFDDPSDRVRHCTDLGSRVLGANFDE